MSRALPEDVRRFCAMACGKRSRSKPLPPAAGRSPSSARVVRLSKTIHAVEQLRSHLAVDDQRADSGERGLTPMPMPSSRPRRMLRSSHSRSVCASIKGSSVKFTKLGSRFVKRRPSTTARTTATAPRPTPRSAIPPRVRLLATRSRSGPRPARTPPAPSCRPPHRHPCDPSRQQAVLVHPGRSQSRRQVVE